jgi:hypothetical protein
MKREKNHRGVLAAVSALAAFAAASLLAPSNAAAQATGLNGQILLQRPGSSLYLLDEPIPAGAGAENGDNFTFNLPTLPPNFSKIHDFDSFRLTLPFSCRYDCLASVEDAIKNDGTLFVALAPAGYCATQFPDEGSPVVLHIPAAELQESRSLTGAVFTWSGRPEILALFDGTGTPTAAAALARRQVLHPQPRFVNLRLSVNGGGLLGRLGLPETGELDADGDADLSSLFAVFPSDPSQVSTDTIVALATGLPKQPGAVAAPSDPNLPLGLIASCETLNAPVTLEAPPGL